MPGLLVRYSSGIEGDALQCVFHMKFARRTGRRVGSIPIEHAIGDVRGRLYLSHRDTCAQRVDRAARQLVAMTLAHLDSIQ